MSSNKIVKLAAITPTSSKQGHGVTKDANQVLDTAIKRVTDDTFPSIYGVPMNEKVRKKFIAKRQILDALEGRGFVKPTSGEINELLKAEDAWNKYRYDTVFAEYCQQFVNDPASLEKFHNLYPEFNKTRLDFISKVAELQQRIASIKILGVQTKDDLDLMIRMHLLQPPERRRIMRLLAHPLHQLDQIEQEDARIVPTETALVAVSLYGARVPRSDHTAWVNNDNKYGIFYRQVGNRHNFTMDYINHGVESITNQQSSIADTGFNGLRNDDNFLGAARGQGGAAAAFPNRGAVNAWARG